MPVLHVELPPNELLKAVEQLSLPDLEQFSKQVTRLVAQRRAPVLPKQESELIQKVNQSVMLPEMQNRYDELLNKRMEETISPVEMDELILLTDQLEAVNVERVSALANLAQLRQTSLSEVMKELGLKEPQVV